MTHEKIIIREDGTKIKIVASIWIDFRSTEPNYKFDLEILPPKKRKWIYAHYNIENDYAWRALNMKDREAYKNGKYLEIVTKDEVNETFNELWQKLKPNAL